MRVLRHVLGLGDTTLELPSGASVLHVGVKAGERDVSLWVREGAVGETTGPRTFRVVGTGWETGWPLFHVGSCMDPCHDFVWHVFEVCE